MASKTLVKNSMYYLYVSMLAIRRQSRAGVWLSTSQSKLQVMSLTWHCMTEKSAVGFPVSWFTLSIPQSIPLFPSLLFGLARTLVVIAFEPWSGEPQGGIELRGLGDKSSLSVVKCESRRTAQMKSYSWWMRPDTYWQAKFTASLVRCDTFGPLAATL